MMRCAQIKESPRRRQHRGQESDIEAQVMGERAAPMTGALVEGDEARIRRAFLNMRLVAGSEGATLRDAVRLVMYVTGMFRRRIGRSRISLALNPGYRGCPSSVLGPAGAPPFCPVPQPKRII